ncbi:MAG: aspartate/glutamate racemase family protein [Pyrinomonadaceae bacterium]|nr:aspartate/glutamate racemase family protein [Pyrinomonadaceae bacterium]
MQNYLGIIDWGIGGISVYNHVKTHFPKTPVMYFSDTGFTPYGKTSKTELVERLNSVVVYLKSKGVNHLVIGCNAASTAIPFLDTNGVLIEGVIESAVELASNLKPKKLGLIGGRRTVLSGVYRKKFAERGIKLFPRIAQPLSALIESGDISSPKLHSEAAKILKPIKNCSHLLLACTHYPAISEVIKTIVSPKTVLIDPAEELIKKIAVWDLPQNGKDVFLTSGNAEQMKISAFNAFGTKIPRVGKVKI